MSPDTSLPPTGASVRTRNGTLTPRNATTDLSLGSFRNGKEKIHRGNHNNLHDITTTNPFHFYTNPKWYESYFDPIIPRNVSCSQSRSQAGALNENSFRSLGYGVGRQISIFKL